MMLTEYLTADALVYAAGTAFTIAYLIINQVYLRLFMLIGTGLYILYYWNVAEAPLWSAIYTSCTMGVANVIGLVTLLYRRSSWSVPSAHKDLYTHFAGLTPGDFGTLMRAGRREVLTEPKTLTQEAQVVDKLYYVVSGATEVTKRGEHFRLPPCIFVGEVAYLTRQVASATTILDKGAEVIVWDMVDLRTRSAASPRFKLALEAAVSRDLAIKVSFAVAPQQISWTGGAAPAQT